jgi:hypothetical protein
MNAILVPSGDQLGAVLSAELSVTGCCPDPWAFILNMRTGARRPSVRTNAMVVPSGDHAGSVSVLPVWVRRVSPDPSAFHRIDKEAVDPCVAGEHDALVPAGTLAIECPWTGCKAGAAQRGGEQDAGECDAAR